MVVISKFGTGYKNIDCCLQTMPTHKIGLLTIAENRICLRLFKRKNQELVVNIEILCRNIEFGYLYFNKNNMLS